MDNIIGGIIYTEKDIKKMLVWLSEQPWFCSHLSVDNQKELLSFAYVRLQKNIIFVDVLDEVMTQKKEMIK